MKKLAVLLLGALLGTVSMARQPEEASGTNGLPGSEYKIGIEDRLRISVWGEPDLNMSVTVRPDGKITFPLVNDMAVAGRTPEQVRGALVGGLKEFIRDPNVTVIVEAINSFKIYVLGEVQTQGVFTLYQPTRLLQAVAIAGGFTEFSKKKITLFRDDGGQEARLTIDFKRLQAADGSEENFFLKPGDTLIVD